MIKEDLKVEPSFLIRTPALRLQSEKIIKLTKCIEKVSATSPITSKAFLSVLLGTY